MPKQPMLQSLGNGSFSYSPFQSYSKHFRLHWFRHAIRQLTLCQASSLTVPSHPREVLILTFPSLSPEVLLLCMLHTHRKSYTSCKHGHLRMVQVADWARQRFYEETAKPDEHITLAKACMLIALEDEAAAAVDEQESRARTSRIVESFVGGNSGNDTHLFPPRYVSDSDLT